VRIASVFEVRDELAGNLQNPLFEQEICPVCGHPSEKVSGSRD
jgi:hypothetical protein